MLVFVLTAKLNKKKLVGMIVIVGVLLVGIVAIVAARGSVETAGDLGNVKNVKTSDDRTAFLTSLGWEVDPTPVQSEEVLIPETWDAVFENYNAMQKEQGMDLSKYKGKRALRVTYAVLNYPTGDPNVLVNLLCYKYTIIGGDVQSPALDGFMHGLQRPQ